MKTTVRVASPIVTTARVMQATAMFDLPVADRAERTWEVDLPIEERDWNIGLIVGPSGAGKTRAAQALFGDQLIARFDWSEARSVLDCFPADMGIKEVVGLLNAVGLGSVPSWVRPYNTLSTGEQFRADAARALAETAPGRITVLDEFTSVVDRQVAQVASHAVQKTVRREKRKLIAVTCHYDVVDWLQPDWIYQPHAGDFTWRCLQRRPTVELGVYPVSKAVWPVFSRHHYLSANLLNSATCFGGFVGDDCIAFNAYRHLPHPRVKDIKIGHRLVVLPDWQGLGLGMILAEWTGQHLFEQGFRYHRVLSHPALIHACLKSPRWRLLRAGPGGHTGERNSHSGVQRSAINGAAVGGSRLITSTKKRKGASLAKAQQDPRRLNTYAFEYSAPA